MYRNLLLMMYNDLKIYTVFQYINIFLKRKYQKYVYEFLAS